MQGDINTHGVAPVGPGERISSVDMIRGFALLGILLMNIVAFAWPHQAYSDPTIAAGDSGKNLAAWFLNYVLFDGKMRALFSMLFGASVVLMTSRAEQRGAAAQIADIYYRRTLWLLLFGVIDAYVILWPGDILYSYAVCGLLLFPLRKLSARRLLLVGALVLAVTIPKLLLEANNIQTLRSQAGEASRLTAAGQSLSDEQKEAQKGWEAKLKEMKPGPAEVQKEIDRRLAAGYPTLFVSLIDINSMLQSTEFYRWFVWDITGMMLLGMGLLKLGVFSATRSNRFYALMVLLGYGIGIPLNAWIASRNVASHFDLTHIFQNACAYDAGRFSVALGHVGIMMLIYKAGLFRFLTSALAAVGQMALSNYLFQNIVCTLLFNGYGFGLFGRLERFQLYGVVLAVWIVQLVGSPIWLRHFRFGPMEWLWRSLTYWKRQPMRIGGAVVYSQAATG